VNIVFLGEAIRQIVSMLVDTLSKVRSHTCIQGAIPFAAKNVNVKLLQRLSLDSCLRRNDIITSL
jgi:hypothetical protein